VKNEESKIAVILVHGLWLRGLAFSVQRFRLARSGFSVSSFSYPSVRRGLDANSLELSRHVLATFGETIHLVGHSLGGLVILNMLAQFPAPRVKRVVLLGSPCAGSHCASVLLGTPVLSGIAGRSLRDAVERGTWKLPENVEIGVLSGSRGIGLGRLIPGLPRPNDGVVSIEETRLAGCRDAITLPVSHSGMLVSPSCSLQIARFLKSGHFVND
jgi:pimeloyl-ACP methyl ester carboxylesterase